MQQLRSGHLFAGAGGGILADLILGHKPVFAVEWDPYCCQILRERVSDGWFDGMQVHECDIRVFDSSIYKGCLDILHAGFPCQDISVAGKQTGLGEGTRSGLYREVLRIAGVVRPGFIFLENVSAIISNGLGTVLADLAALGYDAQWCCLRASDVGAPHGRDRWFLLANARIGRCLQSREREMEQQGRAKVVGASVMADAMRNRLQRCRKNGNAAGPAGLCSGTRSDQEQHLCNTDSSLRFGRPAARTEQTGRGRFEATNWWEIEPGVGRVVDGLAARVDRLKALGNGQVPLQAAAAFTLLRERIVQK